MSKVGYVYKIINTENDEIYVGSTSTNLRNRYAGHLEKYNKGSRPNVKLYKLMEEIGVECFSIELLEEVQYDNYKELLKREQHHMNELKPSLNIKFAIGKDREKKRESDRKSYQKHREERLAKVREYAAANKELIAERSRKYREKNKEAINAKKRIKFTCEICGVVSAINHKSRHERSKYHCSFL